jgi:hypothetical protein
MRKLRIIDFSLALEMTSDVEVKIIIDYFFQVILQLFRLHYFDSSRKV